MKKSYNWLLTSGAHLLLLIIAIKIKAKPVWLASLSTIASISLLAWISTIKRYRAIVDTPTSRIVSAAQGIVELHGRGVVANPPLISPVLGLPCLWYRIVVEEELSIDRWVVVDIEESDCYFVLDDGSAQCIVDVEGAEVSSSHNPITQIHASTVRRTTEWVLGANDSIYIRGQFCTLNNDSVLPNIKQDTLALLNQWKQDQVDLHERFDLNGDGKIDAVEWSLARSAARREVEKIHSEMSNKADVHTVKRPENGHAYLISNFDPKKLANRYLYWSIFHLVIFLTALAAAAWVFRSM